MIYELDAKTVFCVQFHSETNFVCHRRYRYYFVEQVEVVRLLLLLMNSRFE
jgi:hypothetical protein